MSWTTDRIATLKRMWGEGCSGSEIARTLGGVTRNAVIGKAHRMGFSTPVPQGFNSATTYRAPLVNTSRATNSQPSRPRVATSPDRNMRQITAAARGKAQRKDRKGPGTVTRISTRTGLPVGPAVPPTRLEKAKAFSTPLPGSTPRPWDTREGRECAFPLTLDGVDGFSCCLPCADTKDPVSRNYCTGHAALMFQPGKKKPRGDVLAADARHDALRSLRRSGHVRAA